MFHLTHPENEFVVYTDMCLAELDSKDLGYLQLTNQDQEIYDAIPSFIEESKAIWIAPFFSKTKLPLTLDEERELNTLMISKREQVLNSIRSYISILTQ